MDIDKTFTTIASTGSPAYATQQAPRLATKRTHVAAPGDREMASRSRAGLPLRALLALVLGHLCATVAAASSDDPEVTRVCPPVRSRAASCASFWPDSACAWDAQAPPPHRTFCYVAGSPFARYDSDGYKGCHYHLGTDINGDGGASTDRGDPVFAIAAGTVVYVRDTDAVSDSWGKAVAIRHTLPDGRKVFSVYAHLLAIGVYLFQEVEQGTWIAAIGDANGSFPNADHLHFEIRTDKDPIATCQGSDDPTGGCLGKGWAPIKCTPIQNGNTCPTKPDCIELDDFREKRTDPLLFLSLFGKSSSAQRPDTPSNLDPSDENEESDDLLDRMDPSFSWDQPARAVNYEIELDGARLSRTFGQDPSSTDPAARAILDGGIPTCLGPGTHWWTVRSSNFFRTSTKTTYFNVPAPATSLKAGSTTNCTPNACVVETRAPENVGDDTALLRGRLMPNGRSAAAFFEWGTSTAYGNQTPSTPLGAGYEFVPLSKRVTGLICDRTYHYRIVGQSSAGRIEGQDRTFDTLRCPGTAGTGPMPQPILSVGTVECGQVGVGWQTPANANQTTVFRNGVEIWRRPLTATPQSHALTDTAELVPGLGYDYEVVNTNEDGEVRSNPLHVFYPPYVCGAPTPPSAFLAFTSRQICNANQPAALLNWSQPQGSANIFRIFAEDGTLVETVDSATGGPNALLDGFAPYSAYSFTVQGDTGGGPTETEPVTMRVLNDRCLIGGLATELPGNFSHWNEPVVCDQGRPAVVLRWTTSAGASSYSLTRTFPGSTVTFSALTGNAFYDAGTDLPRGDFVIYQISAFNPAGSLTGTARGDGHLYVFIPSDVCGATGLPGEFLAYTEAPYCLNGAPAVRVNWRDSEGAQATYTLRFTGDKVGTFSGSGGSRVISSINFVAGKNYGVFVSARSATDPSKTRESNTVYFRVPIDVCGTPTSRPVVTDRPARGVRSSRALLETNVDPAGSTTEGWLEYGTTTAYGFSTPVVNCGRGDELSGEVNGFALIVGRLVTGLTCERTYHFRGAARNAFGTAYSADRTLTTGSCSQTNQPPTIAVIEPNGLADTADAGYTIRWAAHDPDDPASIDLAYSSSADCINPTGIVSRLSEDGPDYFVWNTRSLPDGLYFVRARIADPEGASMAVCSPGPVAIHHSAASIFSDGFESGASTQWTRF